ncbi:dihydrodipicolinate synthase family protein [Aquiflexum sp.]|uniref:dihydrodipicolinate synthase family protein n=1 Tax=Aquiflexum sp. TaxID=1872584 RepID=UPI0035947F68
MNWKGVFPAVTTKFHQDGSLDMDMFFKNLDAQLEAGVHGIILGGTLGESSVLSQDEKIKLTTDTVKYINGRIPVILNIAEGATRDAIFWAHKAKEMGASALMILPPMRYAADHREVVQYFKDVANSTDLPIIIYNNPIDYKTLVTISMFGELAECENIQAIKESTRDISNVTRMRNQFGDRYKLLCGVDSLAMEELLMSADGWVAGLVCAFPKETVAVYNLVKAGKYEDALKIYRWFLPLLELDIHPKLVQYIKLAEQMAGIGSEWIRAPRLTLVGEERIKVENIIKRGLEHRPNL